MTQETNDNIGVADKQEASVIKNSVAGDEMQIKGIYTPVTCIGPREELRDKYVKMRDTAIALEETSLMTLNPIAFISVLLGANLRKADKIRKLMEPMTEVKWTDVAHNLIPTAAKNDIQDKYWAGSGYTAAWYLGLINATPSYNAADTSASHAGWTENQNYTEATRRTCVFGAAAAGVKALSASLTFSINTNAQSIAGCGIWSVSTKGGTTGILASAGSFTGGNKAVDNGDTLSVGYSSTLS